MATTEKKKKPGNIRIIKNADKPETPELLADSIVRISKGFADLKRDGLTDKAIVVLLMGMEGMSKVSIIDVRLVIENLPKLASYYVNKK